MPNKGYKQTREHREELRQRQLGRKQSKEWVEKRFKSREGYKHSKETKKLIGIGNRGKIRNNEHKNKISNTLKQYRNSLDGLTYQERLQQRYMKNRLGCLLRMALRIYTKTGKVMKAKDYNINYELIIEHLKPFPENITKYHIDHIIPLSWFDLNDEEQIKIAFAPKNHQWLTPEQNLKKSNKFVSKLWEGIDETKQKGF